MLTTTDVPHGYIADVITHLEMTEKPALTKRPSALSIEKWPDPDPQDYLAMFRQVGEPWLWLSRLLLTEDELKAEIHDPGVEIFRVMEKNRPVGFIELDFRTGGHCEIGFFGLIKELNGQGHGGWLMAETLERAWKPGIERVWLHTCTLDSPRALPFYQKSGFTAFKREVSMNKDPRLEGLLPEDAGPHIPLIR